MICRQCGKFISATEEMVGQTVACPFCTSQQAVTKDSVHCQCPECQQEYELESWMEGESFTCSTCSKNVVLAGKHELPKAPASAPAVPHFRKAGGNAASTAAAAQAPASGGPATPVNSGAAIPSFKTPHTTGGSVPASTPVSAQAPASAAPSFKGKNPETVSAPALNAPEIQTPVNSEQTAAPVRELLSSAEQYSQFLCAREEKEEQAPETAYKRFVRTHLKTMVRISLYAAAGIIFIIFASVLYSLICRSFGVSSNDIRNVFKLVESEDGEKLSKYLSGLSDKRRCEIEDGLLKQTIKDRNKKNLTRLLGVISPYGHDFLLQASEQDMTFILEAMREGKCGRTIVFSDGSTLLENAVGKENHTFFTALLEAGIDPNHAFKDGLSPLFHLFDKPGYMRTLLKQKNTNVYVTNWEGETLLFEAFGKTKYDLLPLIMEKHQSFVRKNKGGWTVLQLLLTGEKIPNRWRLVQTVLNHPCAINEPGPDGKTALKIAVEQGLHKTKQGMPILRQMFRSGAKPYEDFQNEIKGTPLYTVCYSDKNFFDKYQPKKEQNIVYSYPKRPVFSAPDWGSLIVTVLYLAAGLVALRFIKDSKSPKLDEWRNTAILIGGFFSLIAVLLFKFCGGLIKGVNGVINKIVDRIHQDFVHLYNSEGKEYITVTNPVLIPAMILVRFLFDEIIRRRITEVIILPQNGKCQILFSEGKEKKLLKEISLETENQLLKLLKTLAGLNAAETIKPQNGAFFVSLEKEQKQVLISTIGLGASGERGKLALFDKAAVVSKYEQLVFSAEDRKSLEEFSSGNGLILVAGTAGNGRRTFISLLLEKLTETGGQAAWIGDGSEPAGSDRVPRLKVDPLAGMSIEQFLDAIPEYPVIAVTLGTNRSALPRLIELAETQKVILLMDDSPNTAAALCRQASPKFDKVLKLAVRPWLLKELRSHTGEVPLPPEMHSVFKITEAVKDTVPAEVKDEHCIARRIVLYETGFPKRPAPSVAVLTAMKLAAAGKIDLDDLNKVWKGE